MMNVKTKTLFAVGLVILGLAGILSSPKSLTGAQPVAKAAPAQVVTFDVACDCRTFAFGPNRGDNFIVNGKLFPAGTLPTGEATNDPTQPVNGVAPIGEWTCRGQNSFPLPDELAAAYSAAPFAFFDWYFILNDGRALTAAGYPTASDGTASALSVTGGIGDFRGAGGDIQAAAFGVNATGCPNFRATIRLHPGSVRGAAKIE